jgi:hypothetical protein
MTNAALHRKVARLEAQLKAAHDFMQRDRSAEFSMVCRNADMKERMEQAAVILSGGEA